MPKAAGLPDGFELLRTAKCIVAVRSCAKNTLLELGITDRSKFDELLKTGRATGGRRGRAVSIPLDSEGRDRAVVRHCWRGGLLGRVLGDVYLTGARALEEVRVSEAARTAGVPTPECLAAVVRRTGLFRSADLLFREVPDAVSLEEWLKQNADSTPPHTQEIMGTLAETFGKLFAANIYHPDLHAGNVLIRETGEGYRAYVIDFDSAERRRCLPVRLREKMLFRFNRALVKRHLAPTPVTLSARVRFCRELGMAGSGTGMRRLVSRCSNHLKRHSWHYY